MFLLSTLRTIEMIIFNTKISMHRSLKERALLAEKKVLAKYKLFGRSQILGLFGV